MTAIGDLSSLSCFGARLLHDVFNAQSSGAKAGVLWSNSWQAASVCFDLAVAGIGSTGSSNSSPFGVPDNLIKNSHSSKVKVEEGSFQDGSRSSGSDYGPRRRKAFALSAHPCLTSILFGQDTEACSAPCPTPLCPGPSWRPPHMPGRGSLAGRQRQHGQTGRTPACPVRCRRSSCLRHTSSPV